MGYCDGRHDSEGFSMHLTVTSEGQVHAENVLGGERVRQITAGSPLMLSEIVSIYRGAQAPLSAPLVQAVNGR